MVVVPLLAVALGACAATPVAAPASVPTSSAPTLAPAAATAIPTVVASTETMVFCGTFGKYEGAGAPSTSLWELLSPTGISNVRFRWAVSPQDRPDLGAYICGSRGPICRPGRRVWRQLGVCLSRQSRRTGLRAAGLSGSSLRRGERYGEPAQIGGSRTRTLRRGAEASTVRAAANGYAAREHGQCGPGHRG